MKKITLKGALFMLALISFAFSQAQNSWKKATVSEKEIVKMNEIGVPGSASMYSFNISGLQSKLAYAPQSGTFAGKSNTILELPDAEGNLKSYRVEEASVMAPELQATYPEIRSYAGYGDNGEYLRFTVTPYNGFNGIILYPNRSESVVIQDIPGSTANRTAIFKRSDRKKSGESFECSTSDEVSIDMNRVMSENEIQAADDATLRTFDLAMSVSAEYSAFHGGTLATVNAAIATTITRQNSLYEIDFAVRLVLVAGNDSVIFFTPGTPYSSTTDAAYNGDLQTTLDANIGSANYDVGHLMAGIGNNGNAGCIGCICVGGQKGSGFTTSTSPIGDTFDVDYVAHELGHQFGGRHTFTHSSEGGGIAQMEPGSGSTIMGYAGITGATDVQSNSDPYFHAISIQQITTHAKSRTCDLEAATGNTNPVVSAGSDLTLPIGTPFRLTGSGSDADGDTVTYCWEQYDEDDASTGYPDPTNNSDNRPLFRSYNPSTSTVRTFPLLADLVASGVNGTNWEKIPTVARSADFRLTARDNRAGGAANTFDDMVVTWDASRGPLAVTSQATGGIVWNNGDTETITWDVNNTNLMAGAATVDILLSLDGGVTYPTTLASGVANDGSEMITVPNSPAPYCRVMVQPSTAPFFSINTTDFAIDYSITLDCSEVFASANTPIAIPDNGGAFSTDGLTSTSTKTFGPNVYLSLNVEATHTWIQDLRFDILSPGGTQLTAVNQPCGNFDDLNIDFFDGGGTIVCASPTVGNVSPTQAFSGLNGESAGGVWTLGFVDQAAADTGTLVNWSVTICERTETILSVDEVAFESLSIYPIPNKGNFTIALSSATSNDINVMVHDVRGRRVFDNSYQNTGSFSQEIQLNNVQTGLYIVTITDGERKEFRKIVIE